MRKERDSKKEREREREVTSNAPMHSYPDRILALFPFVVREREKKEPEMKGETIEAPFCDDECFLI